MCLASATREESPSVPGAYARTRGGVARRAAIGRRRVYHESHERAEIVTFCGALELIGVIPG